MGGMAHYIGRMFINIQYPRVMIPGVERGAAVLDLDLDLDLDL